MSIDYLFLSFIVFAFLGWLMESTFVSLRKHRWINRGFLNGPICPIYGFGAVLVIAVLMPLKYNWAFVFFGGLLLDSALEYMTSLGMELVFKNRWWDYSSQPFNLQGRICLKISLGWGVLSLVLVYLLAPASDWLIRQIPLVAVPWLSLTLFILLLADFILSVIAAINLNKIIAGFSQAASLWLEKGSTLVDNLLERGELVRDDLILRFESLRLYRHLVRRATYFQRRLLLAYPNLRSIRHPDALNRMRRWLDLHGRSLRSMQLQQPIRARLHEMREAAGNRLAAPRDLLKLTRANLAKKKKRG